VYEPAALAGAIGDLLQIPPPVDVRHMTAAKVTVGERVAHLRTLLARGRFTFSEAVARADRVTVAVTLYALLELYKQGEATWTQERPFSEIVVLPKGRYQWRLPSAISGGTVDRGAVDGGAVDGSERVA
jgi:segregation and condensation protein A